MTRFKAQQLATIFKERLQQFRGTACQYAAPNFYAMVQVRMIQHLHDRLNRSGFGIIGAINQPLDPRMYHRAGTHRTGFNCNKQIAPRQPVIAHCNARFAQSNNFRMSCGIAVGNVAVPPPAHYTSLAHNHSSHGNLASFQRPLGRAQSLFHP